MSVAQNILKQMEDLIGAPNAFNSEDFDNHYDVEREPEKDYEAHRYDHEEA